MKPQKALSRQRQKAIWPAIWRLLLMSGVGSVGLALAAVIWHPMVSQTNEKTFVFPEQRPLTNWQFVESASLDNAATRRRKGHHYQYVQGESRLDVELWYGQDGRVCEGLFAMPLSETMAASLTKSTQPLETQPASQLDTQPTQSFSTVTDGSAEGSYLFLPLSEKAYLSSVIDSRGTSVVTHKQFMHNRVRHFLQPKMMLRWLLGKESIAGDHQCLKVGLSVKTGANSINNHQEILETAWKDWYQWGREQL